MSTARIFFNQTIPFTAEGRKRWKGFFLTCAMTGNEGSASHNSSLPFLALDNLSLDSKSDTGRKCQLEYSRPLETPVASKTVIRTTHIQSMVKLIPFLHDIANQLVLVVLAKHDSPVQNEAVVYNITSFGTHGTTNGRRNDLCYELA
jgi:hypothetical protein